MIDRDPAAASRRSYDLVVVGGGVYGACVALEAARRGLRPILLERADFGGETSWNHFRIVHGGLRYLQRLDLSRFRASVRERRWFLRRFPDLVEPRAFLMPLYGRGLQRPVVLRAALALNDLLSWDRNRGVVESAELPRGRLLSRADTVSLFPAVETRGLQGGALWYDAVIADPPRLLMELLRWACSAGATCLNYVEVTGIESSQEALTGVRSLDRWTGREHVFHAPIVINCAGAWCRQVAATLDRDVPELFTPSLAFNLLLDLPGPETAVAVAEDGGPTYFLQSWAGRTLAGTRHVARDAVRASPRVTEAEIEEFLIQLRVILPALDLGPDRVLRTFPGYLPVRRPCTTDLRDRPIIHSHGAGGGLQGVFSVSGVKYTTARRVAERALRAVYGNALTRLRESSDRPETPAVLSREELRDRSLAGAVRARLLNWVDEEAVLHLDDLLLRRTEWGFDPEELRRDGRRIGELLGWEVDRVEADLARLVRALVKGRP